MAFARPRRFWAPLPVVAAAIAFVIALNLLMEGERSDRSAALGLLGSGLICFSIGCVARTSFGISFAHDPVPTASTLEPRT